MNKNAEQHTTDEAQTAPAPPTRRRRHGRVGPAMLSSLVFASAIFLLLFLSLSGRSLPVPEALRARIETAMNDRIGAGLLRVGGINLAVGRDGVPYVLLSDVTIGSPSDGLVAELNEMSARLSPGRLLQGELAVSELDLFGAQITLRRTSSGAFAFASGAGGAEGVGRSVPELLNLVDAAFEAPAMSALKDVEAAGIVLTLEDARSGRIWQATNATLILRRADAATTMTLVSDVFNGTDNVARIQLAVARNLATAGVSLGATVTRMPAADIALQSPVLAWLGVLDAPLSGSVRVEIGADGQVSSFAGTLDIAEGALRPLPDVPPVAFNSARAYFTFDPARQRIDFSDIAVVSEQGRLTATGHTYLAEFNGPWPAAFLGQFAVSRLDYDGAGIFEGPVTVSDLKADLRLRLDPFTVEIGQLALDQEEARIRATGLISAEQDGWHVAVDAQSPVIVSERVKTYWPVIVSPITRTWLSKNLQTGVLRNVSAGVRFDTGKKPDAILSFEFDDGIVRFLDEMPPLTEASGRASLVDRRFTLYLDEGHVDVGARGVLSAAGSVFTVPDTRPKPAMGEIEIRAEGPLQAALEVLDRAPLNVMKRAGRTPDIADASAEAEARIVLPLQDRVSPDAVDYTVSAVLRDVHSDRIAEGRSLTAGRLLLHADRQEVGLDGPLELDGVPVEASWRQPLGEAAADGGWVEGTIALSDQTIKALDIPLPDGLIGGRGQGVFRLDLPPEEAPRLALSSDLSGMTMALGSLGWSKPAGATGGFELSAKLGEVPEVEGFSLSAPGLALEGTIVLREGGDFEKAELRGVRVGDWLDGTVEIAARAPGQAPAIRVTEGRMDVRRLPEGDSGPGDGAPIEVALSELVISDGISLSPLEGKFERGRAGLSGDFVARVNGGTSVRGALAPANAGTAIRVQANDAGGVIRDAGLSPNAREGALDLVLTPVVGAPDGTYDGQFLVENVRLRNAPLLADILDAISVVGLIDQLSGPGILFNTVDGNFRLTRNRLTLTEAAAVGGSLGISADGFYDIASKQIDIQGVVSPVYFVNGIGAAISRRGEGLFGFNYRVAGPVDAPRTLVNPLSILAPGVLRRIFRQSRSGE